MFICYNFVIYWFVVRLAALDCSFCNALIKFQYFYVLDFTSSLNKDWWSGTLSFSQLNLSSIRYANDRGGAFYHHQGASSWITAFEVGWPVSIIVAFNPQLRYVRSVLISYWVDIESNSSVWPIRGLQYSRYALESLYQLPMSNLMQKNNFSI